MEHLGMPTVQGFKGGLKNTLWGGLGGIVYGLGTRITGSSLIGGLISSGLTAAVVKGTPGETISTVVGFRMGESLFNDNDKEAANAAPAAYVI